MDKETLIRLAQPAATFALAICVISYPLIINADEIWGDGPSSSVQVYHMNSCAN